MNVILATIGAINSNLATIRAVIKDMPPQDMQTGFGVYL
jgi:hypothetical protein